MEEDAFQTHRTMWEKLRVRMWVVWPVPGPSTQTAYPPGDTMAKKAGGKCLQRAGCAVLEIDSIGNGESWVLTELERSLMGAVLREHISGWGSSEQSREAGRASSWGNETQAQGCRWWDLGTLEGGRSLWTLSLFDRGDLGDGREVGKGSCNGRNSERRRRDGLGRRWIWVWTLS